GREDPTNVSAEFARNRVRAIVLPALVEALGPSSIAAVARCAAIAAEDERLLSRLARRRAERILERRPGELCGGEVGALMRLPESLRARVLRLAARRSGIRLDAGHVRRMRAALTAPGPSTVALPGGAEFAVRYGRFALRAGPPARPPKRFDLSIPGPGVYAAEGFRVEVREFSGSSKPPAGAIRLDPARLALPLRLRARAAGDRFRPRGGREKKLKAWLIDRKVPREARDGLRLLADSAGKVLWIIGLRESQEAERGERAESGWEVLVEASGSTEARLLPTGDSESAAVERAVGDQAPEGLSDSVQGPK
ncbi:MAG: tRNA lysidine(34) synthetase TilS, partial [Myxococcales bacterium]